MKDDAHTLCQDTPSQIGWQATTMITPIRTTVLRCFWATALISVALTGPAAAQDPNVFERVLVPVSVNKVPGAFGTVWSTELWYRNNSRRPVVVLPLTVSDTVPTMEITELLSIGLSPAHHPGQFLYVSRDGIDDVQFDLRLFNSADPRLKWGTKLPVVREREFTDSISLINVPTSANFRISLRIYGLPDESLPEQTVLVNIYSN